MLSAERRRGKDRRQGGTIERRGSGRARPRKRALLVCSSGGHLLQMLSLEPAWTGMDTTFVTLRAADSETLLDGREVIFAHGPTNRSVKKAVQNFGLAWKTIRKQHPDVILSTGAALAVPFTLVARIHGVRVVYVESLTRTEGMSLSGWLVSPFVHRLFVQWPDGAKPSRRRRPRHAEHAGSIL